MAAHADSVYFEFSPDFVQSLFVATSPQPVEQLFLPLNDHVSALDVWLSNSGTSGDVTFELFGPNNSLLASKTLLVPTIADSASGTRFKVSLPEQVSTVANQTYYLRIGTALPSLRIYYATRHTILAHDAEPQASYAGGLARVGGTERAFAFKSALYEGTETTLPVISNVSIDVISVSQARLSFNASEPVDAQVTYGPEGGIADGFVVYSGDYSYCATGVEPCLVAMPISHPGTPHDFTLTVRDVWGNAAAVTGTFTSAGVTISPPPTSPPPVGSATPTPTPDTTAPLITNARAVNVTHESADIAWTTNEGANSLTVVHFGIDQLTIGGGSDSTYELEHLTHIPGLAQQTTYTATVRSGDVAGNEAVQVFEFTTLAAPTSNPGTPPPAPQTLTPTPTVSVGPPNDDGSHSAEWIEPDNGPPVGGYRIDIIGADGQLVRTLTTFDTAANIGALPEGARVIVYADQGEGVFEKVAAPAEKKQGTSFLETLLINLPYILAGLGVVVIGGALGWKKLRKPKTPAPDNPDSAVEESSNQFTSHH